MNGRTPLLQLCDQVQEYGVQSLSKQQQREILAVGESVGMLLGDDESIESYCESVIWNAAIALSKEGMAAMSPDCSYDDDKSMSGCDRDPITLEEIEPGRLVKIRCNNVSRCYDIDSLKGIVETDPRDPVSRQPFSEELQRRILADHSSRSQSPVNGPDGEEDHLTIPRAIRSLHKMFDPIVQIIEYQFPMNSEPEREQKQRYLSEIAAQTRQFERDLRDETLPPFVRLYTVFGDGTEAGPAIEYSRSLMERVTEVFQ